MLRRAMQTTRGRLVLLLSAVGAVILVSAAIDHLVFDRYATFGDALWSAVLHLLDPSSLQDDEGAAERTIGLFQVIAGLVLLVGLLFTLVADSVGASIDRLSALDPPVRARDHLLIVGGADLLEQAARALAYAAGMSAQRPRVVALAPESDRPLRQRLQAELRTRAKPLDVELVFGDAARSSGFELGAAERAQTVLLLPTSSGPVRAETADVEVMQAGLALREYLRERGGGDPQVRLEFRRGRNVDAIWSFFPAGWDAIVGDRIVSALLRVAMTHDSLPREIDVVLDPQDRGDHSLLVSARARAAAAGRPLRLTIVGCGIAAPALMEDIAEAGAAGFALTMLAERAVFEANLGRTDPSGVTLDFRETALGDPEQLARALARSEPDVVLVTPSPTAHDLHTSDAEATLALLNVLGTLGPETPVLAELFLPESVERLPEDPRLLPLSTMEAVAGALALSIFDPERSQALVHSLEAAHASIEEQR